jgi:hypothetical protein
MQALVLHPAALAAPTTSSASSSSSSSYTSSSLRFIQSPAVRALRVANGCYLSPSSSSSSSKPSRDPTSRLLVRSSCGLPRPWRVGPHPVCTCLRLRVCASCARLHAGHRHILCPCRCLCLPSYFPPFSVAPQRVSGAGRWREGERGAHAREQQQENLEASVSPPAA